MRAQLGAAPVPNVRVAASHREVLYAFPPLALVRTTVEKACADRALCVLVVSVAVLAPYWNKLLYASVLPRADPYVDGFLRIRSPGARLLHSGGFAPGELADFASATSPPALDYPLSPCAPGRLPRASTPREGGAMPCWIEFVCARRCWPGGMCSGRSPCQAPWREEYWSEIL